jgi:hypothetical protein
MPLSAKSPDGVFSLIGLDQLTLENLKSRNRREKLFTAKCCGAPVQIRTPAGKVAHFYHLSTTPGCQGSKGESKEHLELKARIAAAVMHAGWEAEVEAEERSADGTLVWKADVMARRGNAAVALEVQLSNPDWTIMGERQKRYNDSRVRGLWFVQTKKPFPVQLALPIFNLSSRDDSVWLVTLRHPQDWESEWSETWGLSNLTEFVGKALNGDLKWAPLVTNPDVGCDVSVRILSQGKCLNCGRDVGRAYTLEVALTGQPTFPIFNWHRGMTTRRTHWLEPVLAKLIARAEDHPRIALIDEKTNCCAACGKSASHLGHGAHAGLLKITTRVKDLPKPRYGTIEWDWFHRWVLRR